MRNESTNVVLCTEALCCKFHQLLACRLANGQLHDDDLDSVSARVLRNKSPPFENLHMNIQTHTRHTGRVLCRRKEAKRRLERTFTQLHTKAHACKHTHTQNYYATQSQTFFRSSITIFTVLHTRVRALTHTKPTREHKRTRN